MSAPRGIKGGIPGPWQGQVCAPSPLGGAGQCPPTHPSLPRPQEQL